MFCKSYYVFCFLLRLLFLILELKQCFKLCDKSGKGNVTKIDLISLMKSVGEEIDDDDIKEIFYEIDVDSKKIFPLMCIA